MIIRIARLRIVRRAHACAHAMKTPISSSHSPISLTKHCSDLSRSAVSRNDNRYRLCIVGQDIPAAGPGCVCCGSLVKDMHRLQHIFTSFSLSLRGAAEWLPVAGDIARLLLGWHD
jgi:hypothetical protein